MAGLLNLNGLMGGNGIVSQVSSKVQSVRPHILGDLEPKALSSGQATNIVTNIKSQISKVQAAPTVADKLKSITAFPSIRSVLGVGQSGGFLNRFMPSSSSPPSSPSSELRKDIEAGGAFSSYAAPGNSVPTTISFH